MFFPFQNEVVCVVLIVKSNIVSAPKKVKKNVKKMCINLTATTQKSLRKRRFQAQILAKYLQATAFLQQSYMQKTLDKICGCL